MKKILTIVLTLSFLSTMWCSLNQEKTQSNDLEKEIIKELNIESDNNYYENKIENFSINFPKEWTLKENEYWFNTIIFTPKDDDINENVWISVQKLQKFLSVQEYYEETKSQLQETLIWFKEIKNENIEIWWLNWKKTQYEHKSWEKTLYSQQSFLISPENIVYSINYTATKQTFDNFLAWSEIILNSFKIIK